MNKALTHLWLAILVSLTVTALFAMTFNLWPGIPVSNNIMHLLPQLHDDVVLQQALERSNNAMSRKLVILVGAREKSTTDAAAENIIASIKQHSFFEAPLTGINAEQGMQIGRFYYPWRSLLLSESQRTLMAAPDHEALHRQLQQTLYSPVSGINATILSNDPLLTFYHYLRSLPPESGNLQAVDGHLVVLAADRDYRVIIVTINRDIFDMNFHPQYEQWRTSLENQLHAQYPNTELLLAGAVEHAVWGASSAKHEVNTIGNGSLLGIIILIMLVFPGPRPLVIALLPLGAGVIAGLIITVWCFDEIHLITLVFGSSVIGVAMDYSLHYMTDHYKNSVRDTASVCLKRIFPGITFAMITSAIAYAAIGFAPFPILRQIAVFSCAGLVMAWFSVVSLYPHVLPATSYQRTWFLDASGKFDHALRHLFDKPLSKLVLILLAIAMLPGVLHLHANDDMHLLQTPKKSITDTEQQVQALTGIQASGRLFLIEGNTLEELLQRCETLDHWLTQTTPDTRVDLVCRYLPSQQRQQENFALQRSLYTTNNPSSTLSFASIWQHELGFSDDILEKQQSFYAVIPTQFLTLDSIASNSSNGIDHSALQSMLERFQLHKTERGYISAASVIQTDGSTSLRHYAEIHPGIHWMDPVADISDLFKHYREQTLWMMAVAYSLIALLLCWRYRPTTALRILVAPALAAWLTLGALGYAGVAINLFHVLALLLVLGVGIDYSIFFAESDEHRDTTMLAVLLSTLTTLLSFGLLALSQTTAISSFGIVVSIGIVCSFLFSPLAQYHPRSPHPPTGDS